jgi:hypothetical protein
MQAWLSCHSGSVMSVISVTADLEIKQLTGRVAERALHIAGGPARASIWFDQRFQHLAVAVQETHQVDRNGSPAPRTCSTATSMNPPAMRSRPCS